MFENYMRRKTERALLERSLGQIAAARAGEDTPVEVTTVSGMRRATPDNADELIAGIKQDWGKTFPDLFGESPWLQYITHIAEKMHLLSTTDETELVLVPDALARKYPI